MKHEIKLPPLGETMEEGTVLQWFKSEGDPIENKDPLYEIETDKTTMEVESTEEGYVRELRVDEGETIDVGTVVAVITDDPDETLD